jgi:hypothetical protein
VRKALRDKSSNSAPSILLSFIELFRIFLSITGETRQSIALTTATVADARIFEY